MRLRFWLGAGLSVALATGVTAVQAFGGPNRTAAAKVRVTLKEFVVAPSPKSVRRGAVRFTVRNTGKLKHELLVARTKLAPGKLPVKGATVNLRRVKVVAKLRPIAPRKTKILRSTLRAGKYVLFCNLPAHYRAGQYAAFRVR